ncbi:PIN domain-containing protein [Rhodoferax sp.]|uniref:PIN domain-containing protein n=1 Tax=Rhodoferax sp. TaxID=50421 RepID=UPI00260599CA|nr:PIN domain-containing protein [Rhodoferax sp.]MDD2810630.1 PIN domain-containing protein [Rhodoferax sp.]
MKRFLLDTSAILTLRDDEAGADRVAEVLSLAAEGKAKCYGCFMTLMEVLYRVWRDEDKAAGQLAYQQCLALPMEWLSNTDTLMVKAAEYKALYPLSITEAWIAACGSEQSAVLLHKDPEFKPLPIAQELLPLKARKIQ